VSLTGVAGAGTWPPKVQYFSGLPAGLVWVHLANSALIWIAVLSVWFALRDRGRVLEPDEKGGTPATSPLAADAPVR
jgi:hypothetical protein